MTSLLLSNPNLSSPFLPQTFSRRLQQKDTTSLYYNPLQKSSRCLTVVKCSIDSPYEGNLPLENSISLSVSRNGSIDDS
ncbi:hypothetical protein LINPERHAP2_LOCUS34758 [Linum perenne]